MQHRFLLDDGSGPGNTIAHAAWNAARGRMPPHPRELPQSAAPSLAIASGGAVVRLQSRPDLISLTGLPVGATASSSAAHDEASTASAGRVLRKAASHSSFTPAMDREKWDALVGRGAGGPQLVRSNSSSGALLRHHDAPGDEEEETTSDYDGGAEEDTHVGRPVVRAASDPVITYSAGQTSFTIHSAGGTAADAAPRSLPVHSHTAAFGIAPSPIVVGGAPSGSFSVPERREHRSGPRRKFVSALLEMVKPDPPQQGAASAPEAHQAAKPSVPTAAPSARGAPVTRGPFGISAVDLAVGLTIGPAGVPRPLPAQSPASSGAGARSRDAVARTK
jgi:hypothetical protein